MVNLKLPLVVEVKTKKNYQKKNRGQGFCPFLRWLGMEENITPLVWSTVSKYGTISTSFVGARQALKDWGIKISLKRIQRLTYKFNRRGLNIRNQKINQLRQDELKIEETFKGKTVIISADGGRSRKLTYKQGQLNPKTKR